MQELSRSHAMKSTDVEWEVLLVDYLAMASAVRRKMTLKDPLVNDSRCGFSVSQVIREKLWQLDWME